MSSRTQVKPEVAPKPTDLLVRQKCEAMIQYGYVALRQFPTFERHVLAAEIRTSMLGLLRLIVVCNKRYFLGYQIWPTHRRLRRDSITRIGRSLRALQHYYARGLVSLERVHQTVQSWCEHASHANTYRLRTQLLQKFAFCRSSAANHIQARHTQEIAS